MTSTTETARTAKAEALLLHFTAEAHRRKWSYDRGLDDDGVPIKSEAFDALHQLGEEMRTALEELRRTPATPPPAAETANRAALLRAADLIDAHDWDEGCEGVGCCAATPKDAAALLRRVAAEEQPAETHSCRNCAGIDPDTCLFNPDRPKRAPMDPVHILGIGAGGPRRVAAEEERQAAAEYARALVTPPNTEAAAYIRERLERPAVVEQSDTQETRPVTVHAVPLPGSNGISSCCGRPPCEFVGERVTRDPDKVTCPGSAAP